MANDADKLAPAPERARGMFGSLPGGAVQSMLGPMMSGMMGPLVEQVGKALEAWTQREEDRLATLEAMRQDTRDIAHHLRELVKLVGLVDVAQVKPRAPAKKGKAKR
jgi:hypothetical protein